MKLSSIGSALGTIAFAVLAAVSYHQYHEVQKLNSRLSLTDLQASVVRVETSSGVCSGWVDAPTHHVITAAHCFDFAPGEAVVTFNDGHQALYETVKISTDQVGYATDHAILEPKVESNIERGGLNICAFKPYYGEQIVLMGNPLGIDHMMTFGHISNPGASDGTIGIDISMFPGNSGGPVVDINNGCVIASAEAVQLAVPGSDIPLGVNYAAPVSNL